MRKTTKFTVADAKDPNYLQEYTPNLTQDRANFGKRVREIPTKKFSLTGIININQLKNPIQFESSLERDFIYLLEYDLNVQQYLEQPLVIKYQDELGKQRRYTPDFIVQYFDKTPTTIVEIKYESTLLLKKEELETKFVAAREFCANKGFNFVVVTDKHIRGNKGTELINFKFLDRYKNYFNNINKKQTAFELCNEDLSLLCLKMDELQECTVRELIDYSANDRDKQAELIFLTWFMVSNYFFGADFSKKLNLDSKIWLI